MRRSVVWLILGLSTLVAAALRFPFLGHESLWFDETYTRSILAEPTIAGLWRHVEQTESTPPLYYAIAWLIKARSAAAMRAIPALALTAAVPAAYLAFRRPMRDRAALAAAAIVAVSPMLVSYSTDARSYGLLVLTALLTVWGCTAVLERPSRVRFALWALACATCVWTHYFGAFVVAGEIAVLLWARPPQRLATLGWTMAIAAMCAPLVPLVFAQASSERAAFIEAEPLSVRALTTVRQLAMGPNVPRTWLEGAGLAIWCICAGAGALVALRRRGGARIVLLIGAFGIGVPLLLSLTGVEDRLYARNVIVVLPIAAALAAPVMLRARAAPLIVYVALSLLTAVWVATDWRYEQPDWRDAVARIEAREPRVPVLAVTEDGAPVAGVYLKRTASPPAGVLATTAWLVVEPVRGTHDRALMPAPAPAIPGFAAVREERVRAFRLVLLRAASPTRLASGIVPGSTLFPA